LNAASIYPEAIASRCFSQLFLFDDADGKVKRVAEIACVRRALSQKSFHQ
jgi:hypothetical protein